MFEKLLQTFLMHNVCPAGLNERVFKTSELNHIALKCTTLALTLTPHTTRP